MGVDGGFHLGPPFSFTSKLGIKEERIGIEKKVQNYPHFFFFSHPSTFIDKDIIVIISLSFHFSILPTKHGLKLIFLSLLCH